MAEPIEKLRVAPVTALSNSHFSVPSSKPESQRAVFIGALCDGETVVNNALLCRETRIMIRACRAIGASVEERPGAVAIYGIDVPNMTNTETSPRVIDCLGSGLVARTFLTLACALRGTTVVTGDDILRRRTVAALRDALLSNGQSLETLAPGLELPLLNRGGGFKGGNFTMPGDVSSQFVTALLINAPLAERRVRVFIDMGTPLLSTSYIKQTIRAMRQAGVQVEHSDDFREITVEPQTYRAVQEEVSGDYTSASYLMALATLIPGDYVFHNMLEDSLQGERHMVDIVRELGADVSFDHRERTMRIANHQERLHGDYKFNVSDCPNIVPTLAVLGAFVEGRFRVEGASITRFHKSSRVVAMATELSKLGAKIRTLKDNDVVAGFEIEGRCSYPGGVHLSSWGDHRVFMSLFIACLKAEGPCELDGFNDTDCSFPGFIERFVDSGVQVDRVTP